MRRLLITSLILVISLLINAQNSWHYDMYKTINHTNFRTKSIFKKAINKSNIDYPLLDAAIFFATNEQRVKQGKKTLEYHIYCEIAAYNHSYKMGTTDFFSHTNTKDKSRASTSQRAKLAGIKNPHIAENIAYNYLNSTDSYIHMADRLITQWMNSPGHRSNILSENGFQFGCGAYYTSGRMYATQVFQWFEKVKPGTPTDKLPGTSSQWPADYKQSISYKNTEIIENKDNKNTNDNNDVNENNNENTTNKNSNKTTKIVDKNKNKPKYKIGNRTKHERLSMRLGFESFYLYGIRDQGSVTYNNDMISGNANGMFGINFYNSRHKRSTFGVFYRFGINSDVQIEKIIKEQDLFAYSIDQETKINIFKEMEVGFVFNNWFRFSGGKGKQLFTTYSSETIELDYYTMTTGISIPMESLRWNILVTAAGAEDYSDIQYRISAGLHVQLNFLKL